ncbi:DUF6011 domain-containing protein [Streptacidiphilus sp. N1-12]|uniref:DUF6011 domain-containing protein n=2 Tax=Streptacidiphilus alkalitolerans TaxID=3342712 RepID=A0ABV6V9F6_9ACTN
MEQTHLPAGYYAVPDPTTTDAPTMTYWHVTYDDKGDRTVAPWPPKARYGPQPYKRDMPADPAQRKTWFDGVVASRRTFWEQVDTAIQQDPAGCAARYAEFTTRCFDCGRSLRSDRWRLVGIGPDCFAKSGLNYTALASTTTPLIATAHALHHAQRTGAAA